MLVGRALVSGEQVLPVVGVEEGAERLDAADDQQEIVLQLEAQNGGINVDAVAGNVRGRTTNGGVDARLAGETWEGTGLDLATTNGGIRLRVPEDYSARLETRTVNGNVDIDFPVTVQGSIGRSISTTLGDGGPLVRAVTTNGQVRVSRGTTGLTRLE